MSAETQSTFWARLMKAIKGSPGQPTNPERNARMQELRKALDDHSTAVKTESPGQPGSERREITVAVTSISLDGGGVNLVLKQGDVPSMVVKCENSNNLSKVLTTVRGNRLAISVEPVIFISRNDGRSVNVSNSFGSIAIGNISVGRVNGVVIDGDLVNTGPLVLGGGSGNVAISSGQLLGEVIVELPNVNEIEVRGAGVVQYSGFNQDDLSVEVAGSGEMELTGTVGTLSVEISGSGDVDAAAVRARSATLKVSGSGDIRAYVLDKVKARITGSGKMKIEGNPPQRDTNVSGSGKIKFV